MQYGRALAVSVLCVSLSLALRLFGLSSPARLIFDEPNPVRAAEAINAKESAPLYRHPLLAPTVQALFLRLARPSAPRRIPVPFIPRSVAYVPAQRMLYLLSPDGSKLVALSPNSPYRLRQVPLTRPLTCLASHASYSYLYGVSRHPLELLSIRPDGLCEPLLPLPWMPTQIFVNGRPLEEAILVDATSGTLTRWRLRPPERLWEKRVGNRLAEAAFNSRTDWLYVASHTPPSLRVLDRHGEPLRQQPLNFTPTGLTAITAFHDPPTSLLDMRFDHLCLLDQFRQGLFCLHLHHHEGESDWLHFTAPVEAVGWDGQAGRLCLLSGQTILDVNLLTRRIVDRRACPETLGALVLSEDGRLLMGVAKRTKRLYLWRLSARAAWARLPSVLLVGLLLPLIGMWMMRRAALEWGVALTFVLLVGCDPLLWTLSRLAHPEPYVITTVVAAYMSAHVCMQAPHGRAAFLWATISGLCIGVAVGAKWSGATALGGLLLLTGLIGRGWLKRSAEETPMVSAWHRRMSLWAGICLGALVGYVASFALLWANGMPWEEWLWWHVKTMRFHATWTDYTNAALWWQWPLGGGTWRIFYDDIGGRTQTVYLCGAPWLWLPGLVCVAITAVRAWRTREVFPGLIVVAFAFAWLPWMFSPRSSFLYHFSTALPFLYMAVAYVIGNVHSGAWQVPAQWRERVLLLCDGYVVLAVLTLVWLYPTLTGYPLPSHAGHHYNAWWMGWLPALGSAGE